ncbi:MAG: hypothetical protein U0893_11990 [Chloroflexota bacterium]
MALLNAMLRQVIADGLTDEAYLAARTTELGGRPRGRPGVPRASRAHHRCAGRLIVAAARLYGRRRPR